MDSEQNKPDIQRADARKAWTAPRVDRLKAGEAELGTRGMSDGQFTGS